MQYCTAVIKNCRELISFPLWWITRLTVVSILLLGMPVDLWKTDYTYVYESMEDKKLKVLMQEKS